LSQSQIFLIGIVHQVLEYQTLGYKSWVSSPDDQFFSSEDGR